MRGPNIEKDQSAREADDLFDWCLIGLVAITSALAIWLPLLIGVRF